MWIGNESKSIRVQRGVVASRTALADRHTWKPPLKGMRLMAQFNFECAQIWRVQTTRPAMTYQHVVYTAFHFKACVFAIWYVLRWLHLSPWRGFNKLTCSPPNSSNKHNHLDYITENMGDPTLYICIQDIADRFCLKNVAVKPTIDMVLLTFVRLYPTPNNSNLHSILYTVTQYIVDQFLQSIATSIMQIRYKRSMHVILRTAANHGSLSYLYQSGSSTW